MTIEVGEKLPEASLMVMGADGPERVALGPRLAGRRVVIFGLPGAFTGTCSTAHVPSFMAVREDLAALGVEEVICLSVNDPWVMKAWGEATGATAAGLTFLADGAAEFTKAVGMEFSAPAVGFLDRSSRYALMAEDGVVRVLNREAGTGCEISSGPAMVEAIRALG